MRSYQKITCLDFCHSYVMRSHQKMSSEFYCKFCFHHLFDISPGCSSEWTWQYFLVRQQISWGEINLWYTLGQRVISPVKGTDTRKVFPLQKTLILQFSTDFPIWCWIKPYDHFKFNCLQFSLNNFPRVPKLVENLYINKIFNYFEKLD